MRDWSIFSSILTPVLRHNSMARPEFSISRSWRRQRPCKYKKKASGNCPRRRVDSLYFMRLLTSCTRSNTYAWLAHTLCCLCRRRCWWISCLAPYSDASLQAAVLISELAAVLEKIALGGWRVHAVVHFGVDVDKAEQIHGYYLAVFLSLDSGTDYFT